MVFECGGWANSANESRAGRIRDEIDELEVRLEDVKNALKSLEKES